MKLYGIVPMCFCNSISLLLPHPDSKELVEHMQTLNITEIDEYKPGQTGSLPHTDSLFDKKLPTLSYSINI
jgi:hypothetical protein